jgi:hypothetical protein
MNKQKKVVKINKIRRIKARIYLAKLYIKKQDAFSLIPVLIGFIWNYAFDIYDKIKSFLDIANLFI